MMLQRRNSNAARKREATAREAETGVSGRMHSGPDPMVCLPHEKWVRTIWDCAVVASGECKGHMVAHHVRRNTDGSKDKKPSSCWCVPLCDHHHNLGHHVGWFTFEGRYKVDLRKLALDLARQSPHWRKHRRDMKAISVNTEPRELPI